MAGQVRAARLPRQGEAGGGRQHLVELPEVVEAHLRSGKSAQLLGGTGGVRGSSGAGKARGRSGAGRGRGFGAGGARGGAGIAVAQQAVAQAAVGDGAHLLLDRLEAVA